MELTVAVAIGGAVGAILRVWLADLLAARPPTATLVVNLVGSFLAGYAIVTLTGTVLILVVVGLCGALTTFSTFANEFRAYAAEGEHLAAVSYAVITAIGCLLAVWIGLMFG